MGIQRIVHKFGELTPKLGKITETNSEKFKAIFDKTLATERKLYTKEFGSLVNEFGDIPVMRDLSRTLTSFHPYWKNAIENVEPSRLREPLTEICDLVASSKRIQDYFSLNNELDGLIEYCSTLDKTKDAKVIEEVAKRLQDIKQRLIKFDRGKFVDTNTVTNDIADTSLLASVPATSRGEIMPINGRVFQAIKKKPELAKDIAELEETMKTERLITYLGEETEYTVACTHKSFKPTIDKELYEEYYLNRRAFGYDGEQSLRRIQEDYGTYTFVPKKATGEECDDILREFHAWNKSGGENVIHERTLAYDNFDTEFYVSHPGAPAGAGGYANKGKSFIRIRSDYLKVKEYYPILRHEKMHINDLKDADRIRFGKFGSNKEYDFTDGGKILSEKKWYRDEFKKAGIPEWHIDYAYTNRSEFLAVAAEGDPKKYSEEFKKVLVDLGMPEWFFGIRKFKSYNC